MIDEDVFAESIGVTDSGRLTESGCRLYTGSAPSAIDIHHLLRIQFAGEPVFQQELAWSNAYRHVWVSVINRCVITFVEGDLHMAATDDSSRFYSELKAASDYYLEN